MKKFRKNLQLYTFLLGFLLIIVAYFIPTDPFPTIKPMGIATIFIAPVLGILGIVFSLINKKKPLHRPQCALGIVLFHPYESVLFNSLRIKRTAKRARLHVKSGRKKR